MFFMFDCKTNITVITNVDNNHKIWDTYGRLCGDDACAIYIFGEV